MPEAGPGRGALDYPFDRRTLAFALSMGLLGAALNCFPIPVLNLSSLYLGGFCVLYTMETFGPVWAVMVALIAGLPPALAVHLPGFLVQFGLEAVGVWLLAPRLPNLIMAGIAYWCGPGALFMIVWVGGMQGGTAGEIFSLVLVCQINTAIETCLIELLREVPVPARLLPFALARRSQDLEQHLSRGLLLLGCLSMMFVAMPAARLVTLRRIDAVETESKKQAGIAARSLLGTLDQSRDALVTQAALLRQWPSHGWIKLGRLGSATTVLIDGNGRVRGGSFADPSSKEVVRVANWLRANPVVAEQTYGPASLASAGQALILSLQLGGGQRLAAIWRDGEPLAALRAGRGAIILHDRAGTILLSTDASVFRQGSDLASSVLGKNAAGRSVFIYYRQVDAGPMAYLVSTSRLNDQLSLTIEQEFITHSEKADEYNLTLGTWFVLLPLAGWAGARLIARRFTVPMRRLLDFTRNFQVGQQWEYEIAVGIPLELRALTQNFDQMALQLRRSYDDLQQAVDQKTQANQDLSALAESLDQRVAERTAELQAAQRQAEAASRSKSDFLANVSHEIRTPLNGILGMANLLLEGPIDEGKRSDLAIVQSSSQALLAIINDILDFSKIEAGKLSVVREPFDLREAVIAVSALMRARAIEKRIGLHTEYPAHAPVWVMGDAGRVRQVLLNFVGNAIKFTNQGQVSLIVTYDAAPSPPMWTMSVEDTGIGISEEHQRTLFTKFTQVDSSSTRHFGGTGLGLAISRQLAELMGGEVDMSSELGRGSRFWMRLPLEPFDRKLPTSAAARGVATVCAGQRRILLADDNPVNQRVARLLLERLGCRVEVAEDGEEAVAKSLQSTFDLILMDCQMPRMDGYTATAEIRRLQTGGSRTPIVAMTANAMEGDRDRCLAVMDDYISKPFLPPQLEALLQRWTPNSDS